jgi:hypothetical protein
VPVGPAVINVQNERGTGRGKDERYGDNAERGFGAVPSVSTDFGTAAVVDACAVAGGTTDDGFELADVVSEATAVVLLFTTDSLFFAVVAASSTTWRSTNRMVGISQKT